MTKALKNKLIEVLYHKYIADLYNKYIGYNKVII